MINYSFGATVIGNTNTIPFSPNQRAICRDSSNYIHIAYLQSTDTVAYAKSTDGATFTVNNTIVNTTGNVKQTPSISCNGANITIAYVNGSSSTGTTAVYASTDNGATFTDKSPTSGVKAVKGVDVERRGARVYLVFGNSSVATGRASIIFQSSTDGGTSWSSKAILLGSYISGAYYDAFYDPSFAVNGTGGANDLLHVAALYIGMFEGEPQLYIAYINSSDSGATWVYSSANLLDGGDYPSSCSITSSGNNVYISYYVIPDLIKFTNSTNKGATWIIPYQINTTANTKSYPSITINNAGSPIAFWQENNTNSVNYSIVYRNYTGSSWSSLTIQAQTNNATYINTKEDYGSCIEMVYMNGTGTTKNITYDYIGTCIDIPPTYSSASTNSTFAGRSVNHSLYWQDTGGLSGFIFSFDNCTGTFVNNSWVSMTGTANWSNVTKTINSTIGCTIRWCVYANDTLNQWNSTSCTTPFSYVTTAPLTLIDTTITVPFYPNQRPICRDATGKIHLVWRRNTTTVSYANSSDNGATWIINTTFINGTAGDMRYEPSISCDGNNITVAYNDATLNQLMVAISTNNGATWTWKNPVTSAVYEHVIVERRGQRIYVVYQNASSQGSSIKFINSTDGGTTWGPISTIMAGTYVSHMIDIEYEYPAFAVNGNGAASDKLFVTAVYFDGLEAIWALSFKNSSTAGAAWSSEVTAWAPGTTITNPSITFNSNYVMISATGGYIYYINASVSNFTTCSNLRIDTLGAGYSASYPSISINNNSQPCVFWQQNNKTYNMDTIAYRGYSGTFWSISVVNTTTYLQNQYVNTRYNYSTSGIDVVWRNGTSSPYTIAYQLLNCTVTIPSLTTSQGNYSACGIIFYKIRTFNSTGGLINSTVTEYILNSTGDIVNQTTLTPNNGTGSYLGNYTLTFDVTVGTWTIEAENVSGVIGARDFTVS